MRINFPGKKLLSKARNRIKTNLNLVSVEIPDSTETGDLLVTTKTAIYHLQGVACKNIGTGEFFGVTSNKLDKIWLFEAFTNLQTGRLIEFQKELPEGNWQGRVVLKNLSRGIHQLYYVDGYVLLMDTYNNAISKFCPERSIIAETFFPFGELQNGRVSENYRHMNSIIEHSNGFHVMCHNETIKTGKKSEIAILDKRMQLCDLLKTDASCAHDIQIYDNDMIFLDSVGGKIMRGSEAIVHRGRFLKGLYVAGNTVTYGENEHSARGDRSSTVSEVVRLDVLKMREISRVKTKGVIQQITVV